MAAYAELQDLQQRGYWKVLQADTAVLLVNLAWQQIAHADRMFMEV